MIVNVGSNISERDWYKRPRVNWTCAGQREADSENGISGFI